MGTVGACVSFWLEFWVTGARFYPEGIAALGADPVGKPLKLVPEGTVKILAHFPTAP